jgi:hypothetical protein
MIKRTAIASALALALLHPAWACRGPQWESATLLEVLPAAADEQEVLAQVEVIDFKELSRGAPPPAAIKVLVRAVKAIKGVSVGDEFTVDTIGTSCDQVIPLTVDRSNWRPFVAGRFVKLATGVVVFQGQWRINLTTGARYFSRTGARYFSR